MTNQNSLNQSIQFNQSLISDFLNSDNLTENLITTFGTNFNADSAIDLLETLANEGLTVPLNIVPSSAINNANGAYSASNNTIYLSTELINHGDVAAIASTLLEETGHYLDTQINSSDAPGDEGAIFASFVLGEELNSNQLALLKAEDDTATVELDGTSRTIEQEGIIYVNASSSGANDGTSWANAYTDLQDALKAAGNGDQIWVADGTYIPTSDAAAEDSREISFVIPSGVELYGGFSGGETALFERDYENNETILSGNIGTEGAGDNSYSVVTLVDTSAATLIDGFTIADGRADDSRGRGAGVYAEENASATFKNLVVTNNVASDMGGGFYFEGNNNPTFVNVTFDGNSASANGGAIAFRLGGTLNIVNSIFLNNQSQASGGVYIWVGVDNFNVINSVFYDNEGNTADAIFSDSIRGDNTNILNNIFWSSEALSTSQVFLTDIPRSEAEDEFTNFSNNIVKGELPLIVEGEIIEENNITDDPLFVDPDNNDFRLQLASPGIDAGNNDVIDEEKDIVGNPRIFNDTIDIGAYEYGVLMSINNATIVEGDNDTTNLEFTVTLLDSLGEAASEEITVNYATADNTATAGEDYTTTEGTLAFGVGDTSKTISVPITGDELIENDETFDLELTGLTGNAAIIDGRGSGTITNDDEPKQISIADATIEEADEGEKTIEFTVSLNETYVEDITVDYNLVENTATPEEDYTDIDETLTFAPGEKEKTISVLVQGDTNVEPDETFFVQLSNSSDNATIAEDQAIGTIKNNDDSEPEPPKPIPLSQTINRFQNSSVPGTYLFAGEEESANIRDNFSNFDEEGIAFKVSFEPGDDLIPLYRFQSNNNPGTYLFAGEEERQGILENFANDFEEEGLAFYVYGVGEEKGTTFYRFQNEDKPGTYLFAGPEERENILENFPNFTEEGAAFEVGI